jgi:PAS domain S-box-containing protein
MTRRTKKKEKSAPRPETARTARALECEREARLRAERALAQYWSLIDTLLNSSADLYAVKSDEALYQAASPSFCRFAGRSEADIRGRCDAELFAKPLASILQQYDAAVLASATAYTWEAILELPHASLPMRLQKSPINNAEGRCIGILVALRDQSELHRLRGQVDILTHDSAGGKWVLDTHGNIVDVDAIYCGWSGYTREELLGKNLHEIEGLATPGEISLRQRQILDAGWGHFKTLHRSRDGRILELETSSVYSPAHGGRFYRFYREVPAPAPAEIAPEVTTPAAAVGERQRVVLNMNDVIQQTLIRMTEVIPPATRVELDLDPQLLNTVANPAQMAQVLMNMLINAVEAMDGKGRITVSTRNVEMSEELVRGARHLRPGAHVFLAMEDTGRGINAKMIDKVFEPFITSKYKGRGMGLASAWRNVQEHGGQISVRSREGQGATFSIHLPATNAPRELPVASLRIPTGTETVLLVDDEPYAIEEAKRMLEQLAYRVLPANSAAQALRIAQTHTGPIHLAVIDSTGSPQLNQALLRDLQRARPGLKIVVSAMHELDDRLQDLLDAGEAVFLQKPFRVDVLAPRIRDILDA